LKADWYFTTDEHYIQDLLQELNSR